MLKTVVRALDYSAFAEVALLLFVGCFALTAYGLIRLSRGASDRFASIPLDDEVKDPRHV